VTVFSLAKSNLSSIDWAAVDLDRFPRIVTEVPGPNSRKMHQRAAQFMKGYSSQLMCWCTR